MSADREKLVAAKARMQAQVAAKRVATSERLTTRRAAARAHLALRRETAKATLKARRPDGRKRRRWPWLLLALLLLLLLIPDCQCRPPEASPAPSPLPPAPPAEPEEPPPPPPQRIRKADRPRYRAPAPPRVAWLDDFHLQVAARGPRLSQCFVGAPDPGTLRWTTSVAPETGRVSAHELEPMLTSAALTREQRGCVLGVVSEPTYQLDPTNAPSTPVRVGLVLEF